MAVTSLLTSLEDFNGTPSLTNYGGGAGAGVNSDVIIEGAQSAGRRVDNATDKGFGAQFTAVDLSAAGIHVKCWAFVTQWASVTQLQLRISSGADDDHELPVAEYPPLGGFIPVWCDVSRAPEVGGSANEGSISEIGVLLDIGDVGGNAENLILDEIHQGTSGLRWDGTGGDLGDFRTFEDTNSEGNIISLNGVDFVYSRLEIGSATATTFTDSGFTVIFPDQALVASTFMGITVDLQNASTDVDLSNGTIQSSAPATATNRPDLVVSGTAGTLDLTGMTLSGLRTIDLTGACTLSSCLVEALNLTQSGATISGSTIRANTATQVALCDDPNFTELTDCSIVQAGSGHAFEITSPGVYTFTDLSFSGFGGTAGSNTTANSGANDAAIYNNSGGAVTINVAGGNSPSVRNGAGATTTVNNTVNLTVSGLPINAEFTVADATPTELYHVESSATGTEVYSYDGADAGNTVTIIVIPDPASDGDLEIFSQDVVLSAADQNLPINLTDDRVYDNPT